MSLIFGKGYDAVAAWGPRAETPEALADRFINTIDRLRGIDPLLESWLIERRSYEKMRPKCARYIASTISKDDFGEIEEIYGYSFGAYTREKVTPLTFGLDVNAGATNNRPFVNFAEFEVGSGAVPAPEAIDYRVFKPALLTLVDAWTPEICRARPEELRKISESLNEPSAYWMFYLCPHLAPFVTPPETSLNERLDDGGLLLIATTETFTVENPRHVAIARDIGKAVAPAIGMARKRYGG